MLSLSRPHNKIGRHFPLMSWSAVFEAVVRYRTHFQVVYAVFEPQNLVRRFRFRHFQHFPSPTTFCWTEICRKIVCRWSFPPITTQSYHTSIKIATEFRNVRDAAYAIMPWVTLLRRPAHSGWLQGVVTGINLQRPVYAALACGTGSGPACWMWMMTRARSAINP